MLEPRVPRHLDIQDLVLTIRTASLLNRGSGRRNEGCPVTETSLVLTCVRQTFDWHRRCVSSCAG